MNLSTDIKYLQGVGPQRAELLTKEIGIKTMGDMLSYYPYRYVDRSKIYRIREIDGNMHYVQICGKIKSKLMIPTGADEATAVEMALADEKVQEALAGKTIRKQIYVQNKLVNFVAN